MVESPVTSLSMLARLGAGDAGSWRRTCALYGPLMHAWLRPRGLQPADVDDLTQAALAGVVRRLPDFRHNGRPAAEVAVELGVTPNAVHVARSRVPLRLRAE